MNILKSIFIYNYLFIINIFGVFTDIKNYVYALDVNKKLKQKKFWSDKNTSGWKLDWFGMPYTVLTYTDKFYEQPEHFQRVAIIRDLAPIMQEYNEFNCYEIVKLKQKRLKYKGDDSLSILIYYRPIFYYFGWFNITTTIGLIWYFSDKYNMILDYLNPIIAKLLNLL